MLLASLDLIIWLLVSAQITSHRWCALLPLLVAHCKCIWCIVAFAFVYESRHNLYQMEGHTVDVLVHLYYYIGWGHLR